MARLTIESELTGSKITLIVSPSDALEVLHKFQNKYPNTSESRLSVDEFINRWTMVDIYVETGRSSK